MSHIYHPVKHLSRRLSQRLSAYQRRWARVHDVRFLATHQTQERIQDRYRDKLHQKAKEKGLNDISELKEVYKDKIVNLKQKASVPGANTPVDADAAAAAQQAQADSPWPKPPPPPVPQSSSDSAAEKVPPGVKTLSSFLDVPKALELPKREIEALWRLRHANAPQTLCASMAATTFANIVRNARRHPQFILPGLPAKVTGEGAEEANTDQAGAAIHFLQWTFPSPETATVLFTHLAEYKLRGEHAQPHTTLTHHLELAQSKDLVLCQGTVVPDRGVSIDEGKWFIMQLERFYNIGEHLEAGESSAVGKEMKHNRRRLVEKFSTGAEDFRVEELLEEAERLG